MSTRRRTILTIVGSLTIGAAISSAKLAITCRSPDSEQCVWGRAYRPIGMPLETLVFGIVVFVVLRIALRRHWRASSSLK
ncbi:MAG: hypothetical protein H0W15_00530 [Gemmatimonadales bacterium]|nr:hypothetical protein [Gemmatimonadales bacterium]